MVVPNTADWFPADLDGYVEPDHYKNHPAAYLNHNTWLSVTLQVLPKDKKLPSISVTRTN